MSNPFTMIVIAAILVESVINIIKNIQEGEKSWKYWTSLVLSLVVAVVVSVNYGLDLFKMAGFPDGQWSFVGPIFTGLVISRGSNVIADLLKLIQR